MRETIGGVYQIVCKPTSQFYVGCTKDFEGRRRAHFDQLRWGNHPNCILQAAYKTHGSEAFAFAIIQSFGIIERHGGSVYEFDSERYGAACDLEAAIIKFHEQNRIFNINGVKRHPRHTVDPLSVRSVKRKTTQQPTRREPSEEER